MVIAGKDRGKTGVVGRAFPKLGLVIVEGINMRKKHQKSTERGKKGQIVEREAPVRVSNIMFVDQKSGKRTRVGIVRKDGKRVRVAKKSGSEV